MIGGGNLQEAGWGKSEKFLQAAGADRGCDVPLSARFRSAKNAAVLSSKSSKAAFSLSAGVFQEPPQEHHIPCRLTAPQCIII